MTRWLVPVERPSQVALRLVPAFGIFVLFCIASGLWAQTVPAVTLNQISSDSFTNGSSQHATEVEPDTFSFGSTIVAAYQAGRFYDGGASDIGWATSIDGGNTWTYGFLPGITNIQGAGNPYDRDSDPSVAYDPRHGVWLISSLPIVDSSQSIPAVIVSSSTDGINWNNPVGVTGPVASSDKDWIVCDTWSASPYYGNCYVEWDNPGTGDQVMMSTSTDGGQTWGTAVHPANASGLGGQPVVQPNGTVLVPFEGSAIQAFSSTNGGATWSKATTVSNITDHLDAGNIRSGPLPSAAVDGGGTVYVAWGDCRFRTKCAENDIVISTSTNGTTWTAPARVPADPVTSTVDHFIPGITADPGTSGSTAHLALTYYQYPQTNCTTSTCNLQVVFISSANGGSTWSKPTALAGGMKVTWLASTDLGYMVGDYISISFVNSKAFGVFAVAKAKSGSTYNEAMYTPASGLPVDETGPQFSSAGEHPVPNAKSDHGPRKEEEERRPHPPRARAKKLAHK
jgi:hypothetical protein